jgi:hypothetical protein
MSSVMDTPEPIVYVETHALTIETRERPQPRRARPGFWRTLAQKIIRYLTPPLRQRDASVCSASRPFEPPMDRLARAYPFPAASALAII